MSAIVSRRTVLHGLVAAGALRSTRMWSQSPTAEASWVLIGGSTGKGIYRARWNAATGEVGKPELAVATAQPTYLTLHPHLPVLYACNEGSGPGATVSAFRLDRKGPTLTHMATQPTHGASPCFASVDHTGRLLFTANYAGGSLAAFPLDDHGAPAPAAGVFDCNTSPGCAISGPVKDRQDKPHLHCATLSPDNRFVLACDLGDDAILIFPIGSAERPLGSPIRVPTRPGAGPRHLAFHPNGRWLYCINEIDCTVALLHWQVAGNQLHIDSVQNGIVSIRPANAPQQPPSTAAEIALTRDGRFAYTSTRFSDVLTVFAIEPASGRLTQLQQLSCGGKTPRFFGLDPSERWLVCTNQDDNSITTFARDASTGRLTPGSKHSAPNPMCIVWL